jgi:hypothetical protein
MRGPRGASTISGDFFEDAGWVFAGKFVEQEKGDTDARPQSYYRVEDCRQFKEKQEYSPIESGATSIFGVTGFGRGLEKAERGEQRYIVVLGVDYGVVLTVLAGDARANRGTGGLGQSRDLFPEQAGRIAVEGGLDLRRGPPPGAMLGVSPVSASLGVPCGEDSEGGRSPRDSRHPGIIHETPDDPGSTSAVPAQS